MAASVLRQPASQPPTRFPSGTTSDPPYGPLADCGMTNPFFYQVQADDLCNGVPSGWTGLTAVAGGDGGLATAASGTAVTSPAVFKLPGTGANPPATTQTGKKMFFLCRFMQPALGVFNIGVATGAGTDGIVIQGTAAGNSVTVQNYVTAANSPSGAAATRALGPIPIPPIAAGQFYDLGLEIDRTQNLFLYAGVQLVGWLPQSGTGGPFLPDGTPTTVIPTRGKVFANYNYIAQQTGLNVFLNPILFTLAPVGIYMSFAGQVDFAGIFKER